MKSLELLYLVEDVIQGKEVTEPQYHKAAGIVESILVNNNVKHLYKEEVLNQLLLKIYDKKDTYDISLSVYQRWNYLLKYLIKAMQEVVQVWNNIVDVPLYIIEKGIQYTDEIYEPAPERFFSEDFHESTEEALLLEWLKQITNPKENYILQRVYIDWVKKKDVAKELKDTPRKISFALNKIKKKAQSALDNQY